MKRIILYYPAIEVPSSGIWLRQALMYWDEVGSVVPRSWDDYADEQAMERYSPEIRYLYEEQSFRPFNPDLLLGSDGNELSRFKAEFETKVKSSDFRNVLPKRGERRFSEQIFKQKISENIFNFLVTEGLAEERNKTRDDHYCYYVEHRTYILYMALLAKYLARVDENHTITGTHSKSLAEVNYKAKQNDEFDVCISAILRKVLPVPSPREPLKKILKFKREHNQQLLSLRSEINDFEDKISNCENDEELKRESVRFDEKIQLETAKLEKALNQSFISTLYGTLHSFIKPNSPTLIGTAVILAGQATSLTTIPAGWLAIGAATAGAIEIGAHLIGKFRERADEMNKPFAYLYLAEKELGAGIKP